VFVPRAALKLWASPRPPRRNRNEGHWRADSRPAGAADYDGIKSGEKDKADRKSDCALG